MTIEATRTARLAQRAPGPIVLEAFGPGTRIAVVRGGAIAALRLRPLVHGT